ncbi:phage tail protein [Citrobacter sp. Cb034]|uniref:phage tail protein n=1 Tax=Citrobacter sp. Cb034 TaxID=2985026 RepID=UPI002575786D|nr:phage tail protein [Citrobacter sp. Cb034]MDM3434070.1 phage tail protein [Citrobacter sp. Cb034]
MATKYLALLTNIGAAKLAKATALGTKVEITQLAVGDGNGVLPTPNPAQTALVHERRRAPLNMLTVDPANVSQIIAEQVIPEDVGGWWIREIGLFDKDGDMVAIANCAETYKPQLQEGSGRVQVIRVILIVSSTEAVTLKIDPAVVLATRQYVDSQLRMHEQSRNHPDASTTEKGFVQLSSSVTSDSESQAATSKAVKIAMDNGGARLAKDRNLSDLPNAALARQNLELGDSSTRNVGTTAGSVASGDDARITGAMQKSQNGGDIPDVAKFLQNLGLGEGSMLPVGTPIPWPLATPPTGFLKMNGATFDKVANPKLALAYPSGVLPDLRAQTIRGWDDGRGIDTGRALLSEQGDAIRNIIGSAANVYTGNPDLATGVITYTGTGITSWQSGTGLSISYRNLNINAATQVPTAAENRVKSVAFNYIVRAQ